MPNLGPTELIIIAVLVVLLFGAKKLPEAARSLGRSMRIFKSEVKEMSRDDELQQHQQPAIAPQPVQPAQSVQPPVQQPTTQQAEQQQQ